MKKLTYILAIISIAIFTSCGGSTKNEADFEKEWAEAMEEYEMELDKMVQDLEEEGLMTEESAEETTEAGGCDEVLDSYSAFVDKYVELIKKVKADPTDVTAAQESATLAQEAANWSAKAVDCSTDASFAARWAELSQKITEASL